MADTREEQGEVVDKPNARISKTGHPLLNQVVASKIFEVVKLSQFRSLRLVCKDWYSTSLPIWRRRVQINVHAHSYNEQHLLWKSLWTELEMAGETLFRNFRLHFPQFIADNSIPNCKWNYEEEEYMNMERFWGDYGHWIHKLELKDVYVADVEAFKRAIFEQTPNVQELTLDRMTDARYLNYDRNTGASIPLPVETTKEEDERPAQPNMNLKAFRMKYHPNLLFGWRLFFNHFPNIQILELAGANKSDDDVVDCVEEMLRNPARRPNLPITDLRLSDFEASEVQRMLEMSLVKLKVLHADSKLAIFETAMQLHGKTLEELHLQNGYNSMDFWEAQVGPFPNLTELEMKGPACAFSFHFLNKLPNLKVLRLEQRKEEMLNGTNWAALEVMPHLREFYFIVTDSSYVLSEDMLERLAEVMSNLENFTGQLNNLTLRVVCRDWRQLKKLVILSGRNFKTMRSEVREMDIDDVGITGIVRGCGSDERVPCVADLQELHSLTLEHVTLIGTASVSDGFLKLVHLSSLDICDRNNISTEGLESLKRRLQDGLTITPFPFV